MGSGRGKGRKWGEGSSSSMTTTKHENATVKHITFCTNLKKKKSQIRGSEERTIMSRRY